MTRWPQMPCCGDNLCISSAHKRDKSLRTPLKRHPLKRLHPQIQSRLGLCINYKNSIDCLNFHPLASSWLPLYQFTGWALRYKFCSDNILVIQLHYTCRPIIFFLPVLSGQLTSACESLISFWPKETESHLSTAMMRISWLIGWREEISGGSPLRFRLFKSHCGAPRLQTTARTLH